MGSKPFWSHTIRYSTLKLEAPPCLYWTISTTNFNYQIYQSFFVTINSALKSQGSKFLTIKSTNWYIFLLYSNLAIRNFLVTLKLFLNAKCPLFLCSKWQIGHGKWFLNTYVPICSLSKSSLLPSSTVLVNLKIKNDSKIVG